VVAYHAHDVSWLPLWQQLGARLHHTAVFVLGLAAREAANGDAWRVSCHHLGGALAAHVEVEAALDDAEEVLSLGVLVGLHAAVEPADGALHGLLHARVVGRGGCNHVVELHDDVGPNRVLQRNRVLRRQQHGRPIVGAQEAHPFLGHFGELEQRHHLEAGLGVSGRAMVEGEQGVTHPPLSAHVSLLGPVYQSLRPGVRGQAPVSMLCGHDCNLCAPPIASRVACPGLRPLRRVRHQQQQPWHARA
jgi:hypothetical protein